MMNQDIPGNPPTSAKYLDPVPDPKVLGLTWAGIICGMTAALLFLIFPSNVMWSILSVMTIICYLAMQVVKYRLQKKPATTSDMLPQESSVPPLPPLPHDDHGETSDLSDHDDDSFRGNS